MGVIAMLSQNQSFSEHMGGWDGLGEDEMGGESPTCKYREHEIQFLKISVLTLVCLYLP